MHEPSIYDERICVLGEGTFWHPKRRQLFWFDILGKSLLSRTQEGTPLQWSNSEHASAAGWIDEHVLLMAGESGLFEFNLESGDRAQICPLEADNPTTRSNDGRADPWGGFWIGTMGKRSEPDAGAIYRYYRGELRQLYTPITIPNAICFSPDRRFAYFSDTVTARIWRQALTDKHGWPLGDPELFVDLGKESLYPDGAVVDMSGRLWNAQWGASRVACYDATGRVVETVHFPATQITCPALGGNDLTTLYATSATHHITASSLLQQADAGKTFAIKTEAHGQPEHRVLLG